MDAATLVVGTTLYSLTKRRGEAGDDIYCIFQDGVKTAQIELPNANILRFTKASFGQLAAVYAGNRACLLEAENVRFVDEVDEISAIWLTSLSYYAVCETIIVRRDLKNLHPLASYDHSEVILRYRFDPASGIYFKDFNEDWFVADLEKLEVERQIPD